MNSQTTEISDLQLEKYLLGELPQGKREEITRLLEQDESLTARYQSILKSNDEILSQYPAKAIGMTVNWKLNRASAEDKKKMNRFLIPAFSFGSIILSLAILFLVLIPANRDTGNPFFTDDETRAKGETGIRIYRKLPDGIERLSSGVKVNQQDVFQIKYVAGKAQYGVIFSIDGNGLLTLHFPEKETDLPLLNRKGEAALFDAFKLDNAPGFERFFFVYSEKSFKTITALNAGNALAGEPARIRTGSLQLPGKGFSQDSFILIKEEK